MSLTSEASPEDDAGARPRGWRWVLAGVFSTALATLLAELAITRLFSVILFYHFAFMAISVALLGLGAGGLCSYFLAGWLERGGVWPRLAIVSALNAALSVLVLAVILRQSVSFGAWSALLPLAVVYFSAMVPFFLAGIVLAVVLARTARLAGLVYFADLSGAAAGCLLLIPLLEWLGGPNTVLAAGALSGVAAVCWVAAGRRAPAPLPPPEQAQMRLGPERRRWAPWLIVPLALAVLIGLNTRAKFLDVRYAKGKPLEKEYFTAWNSFSRVGVYRTQNGEYWIQIDVDAASQVADAVPSDPKWLEQVRDFGAGMIYRLHPRGRVLIIGPGGGVDVSRALATGSTDVTGVEINPIIIRKVMLGAFRPNSFALYERPEVHTYIEDGRSFIRRSSERWDVIQATLVDTWASTASGAFALAENNLYTVEAFQEYLRHLTPDGVVSITRWEFARPREALRLVSLGLEALKREGEADPSSHIIVIADNELSSMGTTATFLMKRSPFSADEAFVLLHLVGSGGKTMRVLAAPGLHFKNAFSQLLSAKDPNAFYASYPFNVRPVTDNRPFFFFTMKTGDLLRRGHPESMDLKVNLGFVLLLGVLALSGFAVIAFLLVPAYFTRHIPRTPGARRRLLYFVAIGLAYILAEIAFIQRFVLFLGHPTYALAVAVFALVLSSALGSRYSQRWPESNLVSKVSVWLTGLAVLLAVIGLAVAPLVTEFVWLPLPARMALAAILLAAPGFMMGTAFPSGLRLLRLSNPAELEWAWAMNAAASVLGSALAVFISIHFGIWQTMAAAALCYLGAAVAIQPARRAAAHGQAANFGSRIADCGLRTSARGLERRRPRLPWGRGRLGRRRGGANEVASGE
jgi:SAM-dependent methyltransferase